MSIKSWKNKKTKELFNAFLTLKNIDESANFCRDLMTEDEILEFASRFEIAKELIKGKTQRDIAEDLEVSVTTVTRVNQWLNRGMNGYKTVLQRMYPERLKIKNAGLKKTSPSSSPSRRGNNQKHHHPR